MTAYRVAAVTGPGRLDVGSRQDAVPTATQVALSITLCGVCGTDAGAFTAGGGHSPAVCGHEWVAVVTDVGRAVTSLSPGARVVVAVPPPCGTCPECRGALHEHCRHVSAVARGRDPAAPEHGGFAQRLFVDQMRVLPALDALTDVEAALVEPAAVALHGVRRAGVVAGDVVVVQGAGPIGVLAAQCARVAGAATVVVVEPQEDRRPLAVTLGADVAVAPGEAAALLVDEVTEGRGADVVVECAGRPELLATALGLARRGGTVLLLGYTAQAATVRHGTLPSWELVVRGALAATRDDVRRTMRLIAAGRLQVAPLPTSTVGLEGLAGVLADLAGGRSPGLKVLVDPQR